MLSAAALGFALLSPLPQPTDVLQVVFSDVERRLICEHYAAACSRPGPGGGPHDDQGKGKGKDKGKNEEKGRGGSGGLPPGLAKRPTLPPGLQKQLDEKGRLPPGLERRRLPDSLSERLPARPRETEIVVVNRDVLLIQAATGLVYDIIADIVRD